MVVIHMKLNLYMILKSTNQHNLLYIFIVYLGKMHQQTDGIQPSFGSSLKKQSTLERGRDMIWKLDSSSNIDDTQNEKRLIIGKNKSSSEMFMDSLMMTNYETQDGSSDHWKSYSNSVLLHDRPQPKKFKDIKAQNHQISNSEQSVLIDENRKLKNLVKKLTSQNQILLSSFKKLESQTQKTLPEDLEQQYKNKFLILFDRIDELQKQNQFLASNLTNQQTNSDNIHNDGAQYEKFVKKSQLYERQINRLMKQLEKKKLQILQQTQVSQELQTKLFKKDQQNTKLNDQIKHFQNLLNLNKYKNQQANKCYETMNQSNKRTINLLQQHTKQIEQQNISLKKKFENQFIKNKKSDKKILEYGCEIDRLNKVLKQENLNRRKIEVQHEKLKQMLKLQKSLQVESLPKNTDIQVSTPTNQKNKLLSEIKRNIAKSCQILPNNAIKLQSNDENVEILEDQVLRLESMLVEQQKQTYSYKKKIVQLQKNIQRYEINKIQLQQRVKIMQEQLNDSSQSHNLYTKQCIAHKKTTKRLQKALKNQIYTQNYIQYLQSEINRHKQFKNQYPHLNQQMVNQIKNLHNQYQKILKYSHTLQQQNSNLYKKLQSITTKTKLNNQYYQNLQKFYEEQLQRVKQTHQKLQINSQNKIQELLQIIQQLHQQQQQSPSQCIITEQQNIIKQLKYENIKNNQQKKQLQQKIHHLQKQQIKLQEQIKQFKEEEEEDIQQLENLLDKLEIYQEQLDFLCEENRNLKQQLLQARNTHNQYNQKIQQIQQQNQSKLAEIHLEYQATITHLQQQIHQLQVSHNNYQNNINNAADYFQKGITEIQTDLVQFRQQYENLQKIKLQNQQGKTMVGQLNKEKIRLLEAVHQKQQVIKRIYDINMELSDHIKKLQQQAAQFKKQSENNQPNIIHQNKYNNLHAKYLRVCQNQANLQQKLKDISVEFEKLKKYFIKIKSNEHKLISNTHNHVSLTNNRPLATANQQ